MHYTVPMVHTDLETQNSKTFQTYFTTFQDTTVSDINIYGLYNKKLIS